MPVKKMGIMFTNQHQQYYVNNSSKGIVFQLKGKRALKSSIKKPCDSCIAPPSSTSIDALLAQERKAKAAAREREAAAAAAAAREREAAAAAAAAREREAAAAAAAAREREATAAAARERKATVAAARERGTAMAAARKREVTATAAREREMAMAADRKRDVVAAAVVVREREAVVVREREAVAAREREAVAAREREAVAAHEREATAVHEREATAVHEREAAAVHEREAAAVHEREAAAAREREAMEAAIREREAAAAREREATEAAAVKAREQAEEEVAAREEELGEVFEKSNTSVLTDNFESAVMQNKKHVLLLMYAPWCGWCKRMAPDFIKATETLASTNSVELMVVDATQWQVTHPKIQIQGFPTAFLFKNDDKENPIEYNGDRSTKDLVKFVETHINVTVPNVQLEITEVNTNKLIEMTDNFENVVMNNDDDVFVMFYAPWCGWCKKMMPEVEALAQHYSSKNKLRIVRMDATAHQLVHDNVKIYGFPLVHLFKANDKANPVEYRGDRTKDDMVMFIEEHAVNK